MGDFRDPAVAESWHATQLSHPARGEQLDVLLTAVAAFAPRRILDAGVGSGLVAERVLDRLQDARLVGIDFSPSMLSRARARLERCGARVELVGADLSEPGSIRLDGSFDCALTVQTLHNIEHDGQRRALTWLGGKIAPGGFLVSLDKVAVSEALYSLYPALAHLPADFPSYAALEAAHGEHAPRLEVLLTWLRESGLEPAVLDLRATYALVAARARAD